MVKITAIFFSIDLLTNLDHLIIISSLPSVDDKHCQHCLSCPFRNLTFSVCPSFSTNLWPDHQSEGLQCSGLGSWIHLPGSGSSQSLNLSALYSFLMLNRDNSILNSCCVIIMEPPPHFNHLHSQMQNSWRNP